MNFPKLTIEHNHGVMVLSGAVVDADGTARGTILGGGVTSRLFSATSHRAYDIGAEGSFPLWGRKPYEVAPGEFRVSCCFF